MMFCGKFRSIGQMVENTFYNFLMYFPYLVIASYFRLEKGMVLHFNKLKSPSPRDVLFYVYLK